MQKNMEMAILADGLNTRRMQINYELAQGIQLFLLPALPLTFIYHYIQEGDLKTLFEIGQSYGNH